MNINSLNLEELDSRYQYSYSYKQRWVALYTDLYRYVLPDRDALNVFYNFQDIGKPNTVSIWDSTAVYAAKTRANDLVGLLFPKDRPWGGVSFDEEFYSKDFIENPDHKQKLDEINSRVYHYIQKSNLNRVASSSFMDLNGGTAAMWFESPSDAVPIYFRSIPALCLIIEYSNDDMINNCWYLCKMNGRTILSLFPDYRGESRRSMIDDPDSDRIVRYGQIILENGNFYIYAVINDDPFSLLFGKEMTYQQIIIIRDIVRPGECEGRGVALDMMPIIKDLNRIVAYDRKSMAQKAEPPLFYDADQNINPYAFRQWAGAMIPRDPGRRNPIEALQMPTYPDVFNQIQDLRNEIKSAFQVDPLGNLQQPKATATEVAIRENRAQRTSATDIGRLINEGPAQIYFIIMKALNERNLLSRDRKSLKIIDHNFLRFNFQSPLYDFEKERRLNAFNVRMQTVQQFWGGPAAAVTTKMDEVNDFLTENLGLPHKLFMTKDEINAALKNASNNLQNSQPPQGNAFASPVNLPQKPEFSI